MNLTNEQQAIIHSTGNIKINAVAGSGKTTTVIEYARSRPKQSRILYLAFNKSVKLEAIQKFTDKGLNNVQVETAHSLAYHHIVKNSGYNINAPGYKTHEIKDLLEIKGYKEKHTEYVIANHVQQFVSYFCNSTAKKVKNLNYLDVIAEPKARVFVQNFYDDILQYTRLFLAKMERGEIDITHDFYLKKFQLSQPVLPYNYILFDEGQDASSAMLEVFLKQKGTKVIVGDTHQQIYGWRYAVNSLEKVDYPSFNLSNSFRFEADVASLAGKILQWKKYLTNYQDIDIKGIGNNDAVKTQATLARSNLALLVKAIELAVEEKEIKNLYFEGNINSYTYADEGASIYDVLSLYNGRRKGIRDKLIKSMNSMSELEDYIEKTEDRSMKMVVDVVKKYRNSLPTHIQTIKNMHLVDEEKHNADMVFSTVHRCKGMEYDVVTLENDFLNEATLLKIMKESKESDLPKQKLLEEINVLYVAVTRTKNLLHIPEELMPQSKVNVIQKPLFVERPNMFETWDKDLEFGKKWSARRSRSKRSWDNGEMED
ncbi:MAG: 3'-5' exonuclease [Chitinophagales bacterium]